MPSPVSPDSGAPEHQPDQRRQNNRPQFGTRPRQAPNGPPPNGGRPQSGQFPAGRPQPGQNQPGQQGQPGQPGQNQPGQFRTGQFQDQPAQSGQSGPSGQFRSSQFRPGDRPATGQFRTGQPQLDQFSTRSAEVPPRAPGRPGESGRKSHAKRDWIWSIVAFLVAAGVIVAVGIHFFGPNATDESTASWAINSCAGPSPAASDAPDAGAAEGAEGTEGAVDTYRPLPCDDPEATVTVLDIQDAVSVAQLHCPAGSDVVFQKDGQAGGETQAVCARNLSDDHPGDPGQGGGQLLTGDCVDGDGNEVACVSKGAHKVVGLIVGGSECPEGTANQLDLGFDPQRSYETICLEA